MEKIEKYIEVNVPVSTAYNQWTQFEEFPNFMHGIKRIEQKDSTHLHWVADIGGKEKEWDAEITKQEPDRLIAWQSTTGTPVRGIITFDVISPSTTKITLQMEYDPQGLIENVGDALGLVSMRVEGDLKRFKKYIEERGQETGAWRGVVDNPSHA